ncbi:regulator of (H+)-ATPase in vacuolar membrane [Tulasnella sp. 331]|nr:regulator of (H+)-ATPase in vacuolar membrane [Tulasnella sp. 331]
MLDNLQPICGPSNLPPLSLTLDELSLLVYATSDTVTLLDARTLTPVRVLAFWEAFPGAFGGEGVVDHVAVDEEQKMIAASMGSQLAFWTCIGDETGKRWRVHSTLAIPSEVSCLDCSSGVKYHAPPFYELYRLKTDGDLPIWVKEWSLRHITCVSAADSAVVLFSTRTHAQTQRIRHPYPPMSIRWRTGSNRNDLILFTLTLDGTVRIFMTVLDAPNLLQLHATIDKYSFLSNSTFSEPAPGGSSVFWLDPKAVRRCLTDTLHEEHDGSEVTQRRRPLAEQILKEGWDLFARVLTDGSVVVRALANIDRRPPTMLKQFTISHTPPGSLLFGHDTHLPTHFSLHAAPGSPPTLLTYPVLRTYALSTLLFLDGQAAGIRLAASGWDAPPVSKQVECTQKTDLEREIRGFVRTHEGDAICVVREGGGREIRTRRTEDQLELLVSFAIQEEGKDDAVYQSKALVVYHFPPNSDMLCEKISVTTSSKPVLFSLPRIGSSSPIACATSSGTYLILVEVTPNSSGQAPKLVLRLQETKPLPVDSPPALIMPVDPMAWRPPTDKDRTVANLGHRHMTRDAFVSVSPEGELCFWVASTSISGLNGKRKTTELPGWRSTGRVRTRRREIAMAQCSSAKKTVLVVDLPEGQEVTIWDSIESEFSSGLEHRQVFSEEVNDLDWTSTYDGLSILALGFAQKVVLLSSQRMSYFDERPTWGVLKVLDTSGDSIWMSGGSLVVAAGHQMFSYSDHTQSTPDDSQEGLFQSVARQNGPLDVFHPQLILQCLLWGKINIVKRIICNLAHNVKAAAAGALQRDIHRLPMEAFWEDDVISLNSQGKDRSRVVPFFTAGSSTPHADENDEDFSRDLVDRVMEALEKAALPHLTPSEMEHLIVLIHTTLEIDEQRRSLDANGLRYLISMRSFFIINKRAAGDAGVASPSGKTGVLAPFARARIRYRDIIWAFHSESQEILMTASTSACGGKMLWMDARALGVFLWCNSAEALRNQMEVIARNNYMLGEARDPVTCCLYYFALGKVKLVYGLWKQAAWHKEQPMMLKFLANDFSEERWKTAALKNAFALLSKQRYGEDARLIALDLVDLDPYLEYAAAFFLLGGSLKDAVNVCLKQLADFQLAVALARVVEGDDGPVLKNILEKNVIPRAFKEGNRWLGSWAFWMLKRRDIAVRILLTPLHDLATALQLQLDEIGDPHYDDPSLALLFGQLKGKSLQTAKGTSEISGATEFNFVLQMARVLCRMGCHVLAVDLVRNWSFHRPTIPIVVPPTPLTITEELDAELQDLANGEDSLPRLRRTSSTSQGRGPPSPTLRKNISLLRRSSVIIDMDLPSFPPTRPSSPPSTLTTVLEAPVNGVTNGDSYNGGSGEQRGRAAKREPSSPIVEDAKARKAALGSLMKSAKKDVLVPEFDMSNFGF